MEPSVKKILNNGVFIAELATLFDSKEARDLAQAARIYRNILDGLGIEIPIGDFEGCDQAQQLIEWWRDGKPDAELMREWTADIRAAIAELANGNLP